MTNKDLRVIKAHFANLAGNMNFIWGLNTGLVTGATIFKIGVFLGLTGVALLEVVDLLKMVCKLAPLGVVERADMALVLQLEMDLLKVSL